MRIAICMFYLLCVSLAQCAEKAVTVAVLDFKNETIRKEFDHLTRDLPNMLTRELLAERGFTVVPRENLEGLHLERRLAEMKLVSDRKVEKPVSADVIIEGKFYHRQDQSWVTLTFIAPGVAGEPSISVPVDLKDVAGSAKILAKKSIAHITKAVKARGTGKKAMKAKATVKKAGEAPDRRIAVWDFTVSDGELESHGLGMGFAEMLTASLSSLDSIAIVDRIEIDKLLAEQELALAAISDRQRGLKIGKLAGADVLLIGSITHVNKELEAQVFLIDTSHATVLTSVSAKGDLGDMLALARNLSRDITKYLTGKKGKVVIKSTDAMRHREAEKYVKRAEEYLLHSNYARAVELCKTAALLDHTMPETHEMMLRCYEHDKKVKIDVAEAAANYLKYETRPGRRHQASARRFLAWHYEKTDPATAEFYWKELLEIHGWCHTASRAMYQLYKNDPNEVERLIEYLQDVIKRKPGWVHSRYALEEVIAEFRADQQKRSKHRPVNFDNNLAVSWMSEMAMANDYQGFERYMSEYMLQYGKRREDDQSNTDANNEWREVVAVLKLFFDYRDRDMAHSAIATACRIYHSNGMWQDIVDLCKRYDVYDCTILGDDTQNIYVEALRQMNDVDEMRKAYARLIRHGSDEPAMMLAYKLQLAECLQKMGEQTKAYKLCREVAESAFPVSAESETALKSLAERKYAEDAKPGSAMRLGLFYDRDRHRTWGHSTYKFTWSGFRGNGFVLRNYHRNNWLDGSCPQDDIEQLTSGLLQAYSVVILSRLSSKQLKPTELKSLIKYVKGGGSLILLDAFLSSADQDVKFLQQLGMAVDHENTIGISSAAKRKYPTLLAASSGEHPLNKGVSRLIFSSAKPLKYENGKQVFVADGVPVVVAGELGEGKFVVSGMRYDFMAGPKYERPDETAAYEKFMANACEWMLGYDSSSKH